MSHDEASTNGLNPSMDTPSAPQNELTKKAREDGSNSDERPAKKARIGEPDSSVNGSATNGAGDRRKGTAPVKAEYLLYPPGSKAPAEKLAPDDDQAEAAPHDDRDQKKGKLRDKARGMNTGRKFGKSQDEKGLCSSRAHRPEFSPEECQFGESCRFEHDLRKYLSEHKREDLDTFGGICPVWQATGTCPTGWKCRFVSSHMKERDIPDGRRELVLVENDDLKEKLGSDLKGYGEGNINVLSAQDRTRLTKRQVELKQAEQYTAWLEDITKGAEKGPQGRGDAEAVEDNRAMYKEPPFLPSEKRRLYFGPETPTLAPLTTQGNMPFRRICIDYGCQFTYSEMAKGLPLIQGSKSEWALMRAHASEVAPPSVSDKAKIVEGYDNSKDLKFAAQIAANKPWLALKATETLNKFCPRLRVIDLNCGCPIDAVYREGAGSALLDHHSKLEKILRGMNAVSGSIPITAKIRMGTRDNQPTALKLVQRLTLGGHEQNTLGLGPPGVAAITLHGRSRQQRYTRSADWEYISQCAALVKKMNEEADAVADTIREPEDRSQPPGRKVFFLGNGDCYSYEDYNDHIQNANVDTVMVARGALIKPWIFEEIQSGQYLDKSASERLELVGKFARYGLETWGSDEHGVGTTRRFLLEWLSFAYRYIPIGLLEYLPPNIQDRPPAWKGRNELETLLGSDNYKDWIKISDMFLGPAHKDFKFEPKHKSNAYEAEG